jgi:nucleoside-diphosphate-sugar epimerase
MKKKALVSGSAGFVGRHMVRELEAREYVVSKIDLLEPGNSRDVIEFFEMRNEQYDLVVHAAAREPHRAAIDSKPRNFAYNVMLDAAMFTWAMRTQQRHVLYLSSCAVYPLAYQARPSAPLEESDVNPDFCDEPDSSYGWTKLTGERLATNARSAGVNVTIVRPFSGYGTDQPENWPFGAFLARAKRREDPFTIWGNGNQVRDWIHIDDVIQGALALVDAGVSDPVNLSTGIGTSMRQLAELITETAGYKPAFRTRSDKPNGVEYRVGSTERLSNYYKPKITLAEGVRRALEGEANGPFGPGS